MFVLRLIGFSMLAGVIVLAVILYRGASNLQEEIDAELEAGRETEEEESLEE